ncbi:MAG: Asp-tRNA(Asn)/Glu-tRNA(Gln) amidotransferase subunit GatB [Mycoplasmatales bacterium]|nr:Asp-tRNA(Asn)/Glu-tRNA(Gln) amidotransferase subunit GatB [Mycoplasmatales bacterium]
MNNFEVIIGVEIHIELNTKTKMFSSAPNLFNSKPNTNVSPVDIAYPGTLPVVNKEAVIKAIKLAKALNMNIEETLFFDRKNYFYADLPKGYQITQQDKPIGSEGNIKLSNGDVKIERIHLEEDTAKSIHKGDLTLLDYNRAGVPLVEIVTYPVIKNARQAAEYVNSIRELSSSLGISDAKMEEGSLRADINISLRPYGQKNYGTKVEIKNLNSIANIEESIDLEIKKQTKMILNGEIIEQTTKRFDEEKRDTIIMRTKTESIDYKFFPEPNIPPIFIGKEFIDSVKINELPWEKRIRYQNEGISSDYIEKLLSNVQYSDFFDQVKYSNREKFSKFFFAEIVSLANKMSMSINSLNLNKADIEILLKKMDDGEISGKHAKNIIPDLINQKSTVQEIIERKKMKQISDKNILNDMLDSIINKNVEFIKKNFERPERVRKFILGQLMKESKGQANPVIASEIVNSKLGE